MTKNVMQDFHCVDVHIAEHLAIFMPETAEKIKATVKANKKSETLFARR